MRKDGEIVRRGAQQHLPASSGSGSSLARGGTTPVKSRNLGPIMWTTAEGDVIPITEMETPHLFNAMKMTFNHIADVWGGQPVWFNHQYSDYTTAALTGPQRMARLVVGMLRELETRRDLPGPYRAPLEAIRVQVFQPSQVPSLPAKNPSTEDTNP